MLRSLRMALAGLFTRSRMEREMAHELQFHLERRTETLMRGGFSHAEAERRARVEFGAVEAYKDRLRDEQGWRIADELRNDARYAWRMLRRNPGFTIVAVATLAIGIGANAAVFSIVNGVLLRPLPYPEPERLTMIYEVGPQFDGPGSVSYFNYLDWRDSARAFTGMAAYVLNDTSLTADNDVEHVKALWASADLLSVLGTPPALGRAISPDEDKPHGAPVALIGYAFWQKHYAGSPSVLGRRIAIDKQAYTVIGVLPAGFRLRNTEVMLPLALRNNPTMQSRELHPGIRVIGRMKPGTTIEQARAEMEAIAKGLADRYPKSNKGWTVALMPLLDDVVRDARATLFLLLGAVGLVLLIACANVANLLLARAESRRREFAVRAALGAGMARLIRQLVSESVLLSAMGGTLGLLLASIGTHALLQQLPITIPRAQDVGVDWRVVAFTCAASLLTGLLFGLAPALHSTRVDVQDALKTTSRSVMGGQSRMRGLFVVVQLALGLVLLASTGLLLRTLWQLARVDPGFDPHRIVSMRIGLPGLADAEPARIKQWFRDTEERIAHLPGVESASFADLLPLSGNDEELQYWTGAQPVDTAHTRAAIVYISTPRHLDTLKIPLRTGRTFTWDDANHSPVPIVIDEEFARHTFGAQNPIGQTVTLQLLGKAEVIGVAGHLKHWGLDSDDRAKVRDQLYLPMSHIPDQFMTLLATVGETLVVRTDIEPNQLLQAVRSEVRGIGGTQPVYDLKTMDAIVAEGTARQRFMAILLGVFASIAMVLASIGVYGVMAYSVSQRVQEIGIRLALGATARQVFDQIVGQGFRLVLIGIAVGIGAAILATRFLSSMLYGVTATDPLTFGAVAALLVAVTLAACAVPALRAVRIDPTTALRQE
jgi:predicted permease